MDDKQIRMKELIRLGKSTSESQIDFYIACEKYRRLKLFEKEGFKLWTSALDSLLKKIRRSRAGVMAKLSQVRLLLDSNKVTYEQLKKIGDANATLLCRLYRAKGLTAQWIKRAQTWEVERFKAAVLKLVKPTEEPKRRLTFVLTQSVFVQVESLIGRIQTLAKLKTREGALEFVVADYITRDDSEILHLAGEPQSETIRKREVTKEESANTKESKKSPKTKTTRSKKDSANAVVVGASPSQERQTEVEEDVSEENQGDSASAIN